MQAKVYLRQAYRINQLIQSNEKELEELHELSTCISAIDPSKDCVQTSPSGDANYVRIIEKIDELERIIKCDIDKLLKQKFEIRETIDLVSDKTERLVLQQRYLNFMSWDEIGHTMYISVRHVHRIHGRALNSVDEILKRCH